MDTAGRPQILETPNVIINPYRHAAAGALANIKTGLIAWYDWTSDGTDSGPNGYTATTGGSPTYGDPATFDSSNYMTIPAGAKSEIDAASELTIISMVRTSSSQASGDRLMAGQQLRHYCRYLTSGSGMDGRCFLVNAGSSGSGAMTTSTIYQVGLLVTDDDSDGDIVVSLIQDGSIEKVGTEATKGATDSSWHIGYNNSAGSDYYWTAYWARELTAEEVAALDDETLDYSDLP